MPWYLPDRHPIYWDYLHRKFRIWGTAPMLIGYCLTTCIIYFVTFRISQSMPISGDSGTLLWLWVAFQAVTILLFGPSTAVNVMASEREHKSMEMLYLTPMSSRSLVLQKFSGAVTLLAMLPLVFLPEEIFFALPRRRHTVALRIMDSRRGGASRVHRCHRHARQMSNRSYPHILGRLHYRQSYTDRGVVLYSVCRVSSRCSLPPGTRRLAHPDHRLPSLASYHHAAQSFSVYPSFRAPAQTG